MKKLGLIALLTFLPFLGFSQIEKDTSKLKTTKEIFYIPKTILQKTFNFQDINQNQKTQYNLLLSKNVSLFTEYFTPTQNYIKSEQIQTAEFKAGLKIKF